MLTTNQVILDGTESWDFYSTEMDNHYDIKIAIPNSPPPKEGYPVIYILDGNSCFQFARDVVRLQSKNSPKTFVQPALIVAIGHIGTDQDIKKRRFYDFTAPAKSYDYPDRLKGADIGHHGGAEKFIRFIEAELKPKIEKQFQINQMKQTLFGHSLSGLFTLWTLFTKPSTFQTYLASSPSIWWNDYELFTTVESFLQQRSHLEYTRLQITVGEHEQFMVDDAKTVATLLKERHPNMNCEFYIAPNENHASVVPTIMSSAIRFACSDSIG